MSPHGTISRYTNDKCRCERCRTAKRIYEGRKGGRDYRKSVPAYYVREHLHFLLTHGWGNTELAKKTGVSRATLKLIANGTTQRVSYRVANKIMGVHTLYAPYKSRKNKSMTPFGPTPRWRLELEELRVH